jgi:hypothetical protein
MCSGNEDRRARGFQKHDVFSVTLQNWMAIAAVVVIAAIIWSVCKR